MRATLAIGRAIALATVACTVGARRDDGSGGTVVRVGGIRDVRWVGAGPPITMGLQPPRADPGPDAPGRAREDAVLHGSRPTGSLSRDTPSSNRT
jgi:hypothetical protein